MNADTKAKHALRVAKRRKDEALCAWDFLTWGDTRGEHAEFCMFAIEGDPPCSRDYNPYPDAEAAPNSKLYAGTGIGAIYGLEGSEHHLWQLAGWNLTTQEFTPEPPTIEEKS